MKNLALKTRHSLALVPAMDTTSVSEQSQPPVLVKTFRNWLTPVLTNKPRPLTTEDLVEVQLATIRESRNHAFWPPEVIATFLNAKLDS